jgi:hypothetical protein
LTVVFPFTNEHSILSGHKWEDLCNMGIDSATIE